MNTRRRVAVPIAVAVTLCASLAAGADRVDRRAAALVVVEGRVVAVGEGVAEGGLPVVVATIDTADKARRLVLAPREALDEIGLSVEVGDDVRARVFEPDALGLARVQKILNLSRGEMARLRTLRLDPLWDGTGHWQGAGGGGHHGTGGPHHGQHARGRP